MIEKPEIINTRDLILKKDGLVYSVYKNTETPFTGICGKYYSQYEVEEYIAEEGAFIEGMGYENMLNYRENYKNGLKHGLCEYFGTFGNPLYKENYQFGLKHGVCEYYYDEITLYKEALHKGTWVFSVWQSNPMSKGKYIYNKGEIISSFSEKEEREKQFLYRKKVKQEKEELFKELLKKQGKLF